MASIFTRSNDRVADVKRNSFDLSFQNNLTMKFGALYPVFCKEVIPGDTFKITPTFALEFLPMVFPVQTRMRANLHFFYVRNRNLWKDFMDFIGDTKQDLDPPYVDAATNFDDICKTCSLGDYLGIPTTLVGSYGTGKSTLFTKEDVHASLAVDRTGSNGLGVMFATLSSMQRTFATSPRSSLTSYFSSSAAANTTTLAAAKKVLNSYRVGDLFNGIYVHYEVASNDSKNMSSLVSSFGFFLSVKQTDTYLADIFCSPGSGLTGVSYVSSVSADGTVISYDYYIKPDSLFIQSILGAVPSDEPDGLVTLEVNFVLPNLLPTINDKQGSLSNPKGIALGTAGTQGIVNPFVSGNLTISPVSSDSVPLDSTTSPYFGPVDGEESESRRLKISALPFRAYESVYNAFYRDSRNNPFMIDGVPEYNKYIPTQEGGKDSTTYTLRYRNWEQDFLTTAVQSPQQGIAPLVGITSLGTMTFADDNGSYQVQAEFGEDGETITSFKVLDKGIPNANIRSLVDMVSSGISINDLRNVNSLQRWLEANMRKGLRYKDQVKAHYNVDIRYDELDMPEFIGGTSEDVRINMVTQTSSDVEGSPLGSYAGQATCVGTSNHKISHYCDEHGFIIGILSVTPVPNYSQLLPKHLIKRNVLDYFFPEFGHIGFQPIRYNEVCPVQAYNADPDSLNDTFGYQRAWYDYLASTDEVHGLFRTSLRKYVMNRVFDLKPSLSESFLLVDPKQLNEVFASTLENDDKIIGQVYFDVEAYRPIPQFGIPRLE